MIHQHPFAGQLPMAGSCPVGHFSEELNPGLPATGKAKESKFSEIYNFVIEDGERLVYNGCICAGLTLQLQENTEEAKLCLPLF